MARFFVTGTDTGIGKTSYVVDRILAWKKEGISGIGLKPFATGDREDALQIQRAMDGALSLDEINPVILQRPLAPFISAELEGREIPYDRILEYVKSISKDHSHVVVEGAGGWIVPLTREKMIRDFAKELGFPVIVVARAGLGTINHTLLTVESILRGGLSVEKVVLNLFPDENRETAELNQVYLSKKTSIPIEMRVLRQSGL
jgi:dethiobiotin synthetase